jgi:hypothetical protein
MLQSAIVDWQNDRTRNLVKDQKLATAAGHLADIHFEIGFQGTARAQTAIHCDVHVADLLAREVV